MVRLLALEGRLLSRLSEERSGDAERDERQSDRHHSLPVILDG